jgi:hypothetical protein
VRLPPAFYRLARRQRTIGKGMILLQISSEIQEFHAP